MGGSGTSSGLTRVYGTSASAPAAAGIVALLSQRAGTRLGNLNPLLYALGATQYGTSGAATAGAGPFRDVTSGTNTVPGVTGYDAGPGYDAATGLGSPDVAALSAALAVARRSPARTSRSPRSPPSRRSQPGRGRRP